MASSSISSREGFWSDQETATLVENWGRRFLELNRGHFHPKDWQELAAAVNARHRNTSRTDIQCRNRIDTLKKKYRTEKAKVTDSTGSISSSWPLYPQFEFFIGHTPPPPLPHQFSLPLPRIDVPLAYCKSLASAVATPLIFPQNIPLSAHSSRESNLKRNYSVMAAAAAAVDEEDGESRKVAENRMGADYKGEEVDGVKSLASAVATPLMFPQKIPVSVPGSRESNFKRKYLVMAAATAAVNEGETGEEKENRMAVVANHEKVEEKVDGIRSLAKAIERFGKIYEKVEILKHRQMWELEKQRLQFSKDMEVQRMQWFMNTKVQLEKINQSKRSCREFRPSDGMHM